MIPIETRISSKQDVVIILMDPDVISYLGNGKAQQKHRIFWI